MLRYKDSVVPLLGRFYRHKNDIDVFVEDKNDQEFYNALFSRIGKATGVRINKVIAVGSRQKVIDACLCDQEKRDQRRIYIIDGDLSLISDDNPKNIHNLFVHPRYCIENYLIHEEAIIEILHDVLVVSKIEISKKLTFTNFLKFLSKPLVELFIHYNISMKFCPTIPTVSFKVGNLCDQQRGVSQIETKKINERIELLKSEILKVVPEEEYNEILYDLQQKWPNTTESLITIVSGKDYLIPLIQMRFQKLKSLGSPSVSTKSLRLRLAKLIPLEEVRPIVDEIKGIK